MFEMLLLSGGGGKPIYYDSGPGPQQLAFGDTNLGFFGEVTQSDLLSASALLAQLPELASNGYQSATVTWLKFAYKGKYLFIARAPVFTSMNWNKLYGSGLVHGSDDVGPFNNGFPTNQVRLVTSGPYRVKARTMGSSYFPCQKWR
ncbi:hypothetical protein [Cupriavidus consociatus]|uniref:hypothetical protein n=1 Tax=Cupriavidus consociatus TaxID=2821357 RepID=UPI001AE64F72|nr:MULTISPECIES: hypothetical protein [unclassified Cupriavidus]MBP0624007.1 hypothetical protein [Cupriavidus sp. LEh25]MDK2660716.1 hypothetical protein [Cupriavidus sp. LEh21]